MAKTVDEWLAEGNEIKTEDDTVIEDGEYRWRRNRTGYAPYRCDVTNVYGHPLMATTMAKVVPYVCAAIGCDGCGSVFRESRYWCEEHEHVDS